MSTDPRELELLSTVIYVARYDPEFRPGDQSYLIQKTKELKQKFPEAVIESGVNELANLDYVVA